MKAMALTEFGKDLVELELEDPTPADDEVILDVTACGICQTDLKIVAGVHSSSKRVRLPFVPGHEITGIVSSIGRNVKGWNVGDHAVVYFYLTCGTCKFCQAGRTQLCSGFKNGSAFTIGFTRNGGYGEKVRVPARNLVKISPEVPAQEAAVIPDALSTAVHAVVDTGDVRIGERVLIFGAGGVGLHALQIARLCGAHTIVADISEEKLQLAKQLGAHETLLTNSDDVSGLRVDKIIETSGVLADNMWLMGVLEAGGTLAVVGNKVGANLSTGVMQLTANEHIIKGSRASGIGHVRTAVDLVERGLVKPIVGTMYAFTQVNEALADLKSGKINGRGVMCKSLTVSSV